MNTQTCICDADLARLWEGDVTPQEEAALHAHLQACPRCRQRWEQMSAGARRIESVFGISGEVPQAACPPKDLLEGYFEGTLAPAEKRALEDHFGQCRQCQEALADILAADYAREGHLWWARYVGSQILGLLAQVPEEIDRVMEEIGLEAPPGTPPQKVIKLPTAEPLEPTRQRLAAATGDGFSRQELHQDEPPFDFEVVWFGRQLRVTVRAAGEEAPCGDGVATLLLEGSGQPLCRVVLIEQGEGRCVFGPEETSGLSSEAGKLAARLEPILTLEQLAAAGEKAYEPFLGRLLQNESPQVRRSAVQVAARIFGPSACTLVRPLAADQDEGVRSAVRRILAQFQPD